MREKVNDVTKTDYVLDSGFGSIFFFFLWYQKMAFEDEKLLK